jgi:hypothetical protein
MLTRHSRIVRAGGPYTGIFWPQGSYMYNWRGSAEALGILRHLHEEGHEIYF